MGISSSHIYLIFMDTGPLLDVDVTPTTATVLDISPHNAFTLTCAATQPSTVTVPKMIEWRETTAGVLETDLRNTNITTTGINDATTTSILSVIVDSAGTKVYSCHVKLEIPGDPMVSQYQSSHVTIKGKYNKHGVHKLVLQMPTMHGRLPDYSCSSNNKSHNLSILYTKPNYEFNYLGNLCRNLSSMSLQVNHFHSSLLNSHTQQ